jgi:hypothetical protein
VTFRAIAGAASCPLPLMESAACCRPDVLGKCLLAQLSAFLSDIELPGIGRLKPGKSSASGVRSAILLSPARVGVREVWL